MPRKIPFRIVLSGDERQHLESIARQYTSPYCDISRAKIVLLASQGLWLANYYFADDFSGFAVLVQSSTTARASSGSRHTCLSAIPS